MQFQSTYKNHHFRPRKRPENIVIFRPLFSGKEKDSETGYYYFGARYYNPDLSLWLSVDPMADKYPNLSPYNYCAWNPMKLIDPDGEELDDYTAKIDGTIEKKITNDKFDRFFVETSDGQIKQVAELDKHMAADGKTTLVNFPNSGSGFSRYGGEDEGGDHSVQPMVAAALFGAINAITSGDPSIIVQFGDMSAEDGSKPGTAHKGGATSHLNGRNVDVRYVRTDRALLGVTVNDAKFDWSANQSLVNAFNLFGFSDIKSYPNNDGKILANTRKLPNHHHHLHLQGFNKNPVVR